MEKFNEYIDLLRHGLIFLSVPMGKRAWTMYSVPKEGEQIRNTKILFPFSTYFSQQEKRVHSFYEADFQEVLVQYEMECKQLINKCNILRSEIILQEIFTLSAPLEVSVKLYVRTLREFISSFKKSEKYCKFLDNISRND